MQFLLPSFQIVAVFLKSKSCKASMAVLYKFDPNQCNQLLRTIPENFAVLWKSNLKQMIKK